VSQSALPAAPSTGTTAIYGHACIGYACVFNHAVNTPLGSTVTLETRRAVLRYRVISITQYPKAGARSLASRPNAADELILVTCAYRPDRTTVDNLVLVAALVTARNR
jgi:LPXTG-site transpeptidase (sortase) family protein